MYKWKIEIWLNDGTHLTGAYIGTEINSGDVATKLFSGNSNDFTGFNGETDKHNLFVRRGSVSAFDISPWA